MIPEVIRNIDLMYALFIMLVTAVAIASVVISLDESEGDE